MAVLPVQTILLDGVTKATLAPADIGLSDSFPNDSKTYVEIANGGAGSVVVTIVGQRNLPTGKSATKIVTILLGTSQIFGPFPQGIFGRDSDGHVLLTYDQVASVTIAVFSLNDGFN